MKYKTDFFKKRIFYLLLFFVLAPLQLQAEPQVYLNQQTLKVHKLDCIWGKRCTKNCRIYPRSEAYRRGGVACKVCGG